MIIYYSWLKPLIFFVVYKPIFDNDKILIIFDGFNKVWIQLQMVCVYIF